MTTGGPSYTVPELCRSLMRRGNSVQLHLLDHYPECLNDIDIRQHAFLNVPFFRQLGFSWGEFRALKKECEDADIIQTNSLWMFPNFITEFARRGTKAKSVIMPRGTLSQYALSLSRRKKKVVELMGQRTALERADLFIATAEMEYEDIRNYGLKAPVATVPNGIHIPSFQEEVRPQKNKRVVFLSRIHKKKGVDLLIHAWKDIEREFKDWSLAIVGPMNDYAEEMRALAKETGCRNVVFTGGMSGQEKLDYLRESAFFVLPTHSENFGVAVAEALSAGIPAICTTGAPWKGLEENGCGAWIGVSAEELHAAIRNFILLPAEERSAMGNRGRQWMEREFSWNTIGKMTEMAYRWISAPSAYEKPSFVYDE